MSTINEQVTNYKGNNNFILKMQDVIKKYGRLTEKQRGAVSKIFMSVNEVKKIEMTPELKKIAEYVGKNSFVLDIQSKLKEFGKLSVKQEEAAINQIQKEEDRSKTINLNIPIEGDTIKVGRKIGEQLKTTYNLNFNPILLDVKKVISMSPKAVKFLVKLTIKRGKVCTCCMKTLTDEFSMLTGLGKICATKIGVPYITDSSQAETFRLDYLKRVEEIGEMEVWVPKSQIKVWEGTGDMLLSIV